MARLFEVHLDVHIFMHWSKKTHFSSIHTVTITVFISFGSCSSSPAWNGSKAGSKFALIPWRIFDVACSVHP